MNIALFGGTFDPVHCGHLAAARAAQAAFGLDQIQFIPALHPPHKRGRPLTAFAHRYAMVALACAGEPGLVPSLLESGNDHPAEPNYSIITVRKVAAQLPPSDRLYYLIGADAFLEIGQWKESVALLDSCDFIIVSRPGFVIEPIAEVIPRELWPAGSRGPNSGANTVELRRTRLHLLTTVEADISASDIRRKAAQGETLCGLVPDAVREYIRKAALYHDEDQTQ